ncbi:hypothetical protein Tco_0387079 [Tanacetum coccineum]
MLNKHTLILLAPLIFALTVNVKKSCKPDVEINLQDHGLKQGGGGRFSRRREVDDNGSWLGIQRQLLQLEKLQEHIMNMLRTYGAMGFPTEFFPVMFAIP